MSEREERQGKRIVRRVARFILIVLAAVWMLFEEWVWDRILDAMEFVGRLKPVRTFELFLKRQHQYLLLALFVFPFLILLPAKLFGLYLIASGRIVRGVSVFVAAKLIITALLTRLFVISREKLLLIKAFAAFYSWFEDKKQWLYCELRKLRAWQKARDFVKQFRRSRVSDTNRGS